MRQMENVEYDRQQQNGQYTQLLKERNDLTFQIATLRQKVQNKRVTERRSTEDIFSSVLTNGRFMTMLQQQRRTPTQMHAGSLVRYFWIISVPAAATTHPVLGCQRRISMKTTY